MQLGYTIMQIIATLETELQAVQLGARLRAEGIRYSIELHRTDRGDRFDLRLLSLDDLKKAERIVKGFEPGLRSYGANVSKDDPIIPKFRLGQTISGRPRRPRPICILIVILSTFFFFIHEVERREIVVRETRSHIDMIVVTPAMQWMLIDFPKAYRYLVEFQNSLPQKPTPSFKDITQTQRDMLKKMEATPFWGGLYPLLVAKATGQPSAFHDGPLFEEIRHGQIWRLISPGFLHDSLVHLFFNMFWVLTVGSLVERRIGSSRLLALTLLLLVVTNIAQYLVSGPLFYGFSGAACGYVGFIFARRQVAPWENYRVEPALFWLFFGYVGILAFVQVILFALALFQSPAWPMRIANTAHIVGALVGYGLGRLPAFAWRART